VKVAVAYCRSKSYVYTLSQIFVLDSETTTTLGEIAEFLSTSCYYQPCWIFGTRWCRLLSVEVVYMRLALSLHYGCGATSVSVTIRKLSLLPLFDRHHGY